MRSFPPPDTRVVIANPRLSNCFPLALLGSLLVACTSSLTDAPEPLPALGAFSALTAPEVEPLMTWEGCLITPGCVGDDEQPGFLSQIHDANPSTAVFDPNLPDPSPGALGLWIGLSATDCYLMRAQQPNLMIDQDHDGLRDLCEYRLALAFAPMLRVSALESSACLRGEPYWAAKFIDDSPYGTGDMVKLAYLPAYYTDCGVDGTGAYGHEADSEFIQLTVVYNYSTQHWELVNSFLSAHSCAGSGIECIGGILQASEFWGPTFEWPAGRARTFPRVYVAIGKHANYRSQASCDGGGTLGLDECPESYDVGRFLVWESRNLGSARFPFADCVQSVAGLPDRQGQECFWTGSVFRGWLPGFRGVTTYAAFLTSVVFQGTRIDATRWWVGSYGY